MLFGVITLPVLLPFAALLQLLFPGLLRDHWGRYRVAVSVLMTQSTLIFVQWALARWAYRGRSWWLGDDALWWGMGLVALLGLLLAGVRWARALGSTPPPTVLPPARVEFVAFGALLAAGLAWAGYQVVTGKSPLDQMAVVTTAALAGMVHLAWRGRRSAAPGPGRAIVSTELVFLAGLVVVSAGLGAYLSGGGAANRSAGLGRSEWATFRGGPDRSGSVAPDDRGPSRPALLWTFDPAERKGRVRFHSSPTVGGDHVFIGAMHEVSSFARGQIYCLDGRGGRVWRAADAGALKPVFSSPSLADGRLYVGEGYHQDQDCRLLCLDAKTGGVIWTRPTASHVESSPTIVGDRVVVGAADDGLLCLSVKDGSLLWRVEGVHVDASPLVVGDRVYANSVIGDKHQLIQALAIDLKSGRVAWRLDAPWPFSASPSYADGSLFFGLGTGKMDQEGDPPLGAVWKVDAASGRRVWESRVGGAVFGSPVPKDGLVSFGSRDRSCYAVDQATGKIRWKAELGGPVVASPVVAGGRVYVLTTSGQLAALDARTGGVLWSFDAIESAEDDAYASPTLADGKLYVAVGGFVYCVGDRPAAGTGPAGKAP